MEADVSFSSISTYLNQLQDHFKNMLRNLAPWAIAQGDHWQVTCHHPVLVLGTSKFIRVEGIWVSVEGHPGPCVCHNLPHEVVVSQGGPPRILQHLCGLKKGHSASEIGPDHTFKIVL